MANYYYSKNEEAQGPFSLADMEMLVRSGAITAETMVIREGETEWSLSEHQAEISSFSPAKKSEAKIEKPNSDPDTACFVLGGVLLIVFGVIAAGMGAEPGNGDSVGIAIGAIICALMGALVGKFKGRPGAGLLMSLFLGPIGWLLMACFKEMIPRCSACKEKVDLNAGVCPHCSAQFIHD